MRRIERETDSNCAGGSTGGGDIFFEGDMRPGNSPASVTFRNNVSFGSATSLDIELGGATPGTQYDQVHVSGQLSLDGALAVSLINGFKPLEGQSFDILDWTSLTGTFNALLLSSLTGALTWDTSQLYTAGVLSVVLPGDYNGNGVVDAADYAVWRKGLGTTFTQNDYNVWRANFGKTAPGAGSGSGEIASAAVPEPATALMLILAAAGWCIRRRRAA